MDQLTLADLRPRGFRAEMPDTRFVRQVPQMGCRVSPVGRLDCDRWLRGDGEQGTVHASGLRAVETETWALAGGWAAPRRRERTAGIVGAPATGYAVVDVMDEEQTEHYVKAAPIAQCPVDILDRVIAVNLQGAWLGQRAAALECMPLGIEVNRIHPAFVEGPMMRDLEEAIMAEAPGALGPSRAVGS